MTPWHSFQVLLSFLFGCCIALSSLDLPVSLAQRRGGRHYHMSKDHMASACVAHTPKFDWRSVQYYRRPFRYSSQMAG